MQSVSGISEVEWQPRRKFEGVGAFAERCLELGRLATNIMRQGNIDISKIGNDVLKSELALPPLDSESDVRTVLVIKTYFERALAVAELKRLELTDEELFTDAFGFKPAHHLETSWYAGGLIFWCESEDYSEVFVNTRTTSADRAARRAERSAAVALGPIYMGLINKEVPIALVKYETEGKEEYDAPKLPERLSLDQVESIYISYLEDSKTKEHIIMPDLKAGRLKIVDLIIEKEEEKHRTLVLGIGPVFMNMGPFGVLIEEGQVSFKYGEADNYGKPYITLTARRHINEDGSLREEFKNEMKPIVTHEIQHLINDLHTPLRFKAEKYPSPSNSKTTEELVGETANFMLKGPLDKSLANEFLAQAMTSGRKLESIRRTMTNEVENMGIMYNYLDENVDMARAALAQHKDEFDNLAQGTHMAMAETARKYKEFVFKVVSSFEEFESFHKMTREEIVGLLAPHPFHTWPTVLKAVSRHISASET
jgi:hypothetical protein